MLYAYTHTHTHTHTHTYPSPLIYGKNTTRTGHKPHSSRGGTSFQSLWEGSPSRNGRGLAVLGKLLHVPGRPQWWGGGFSFAFVVLQSCSRSLSTVKKADWGRLLGQAARLQQNQAACLISFAGTTTRWPLWRNVHNNVKRLLEPWLESDSPDPSWEFRSAVVRLQWHLKADSSTPAALPPCWFLLTNAPLPIRASNRRQTSKICRKALFLGSSLFLVHSLWKWDILVTLKAFLGFRIPSLLALLLCYLLTLL